MKFLLYIPVLITRRFVVVMLSLLGALLLFLTGSLGVALTHGVQGDFITSFVYSIFF